MMQAFRSASRVLRTPLRREHPGWGPRRIEHQLTRTGVEVTPSSLEGIALDKSPE
jgi:hypothetical protein